ncbi:MAG: 5-formyltetrahydrofolate cyclo-ligase [Desulfobulbus propionicus]|nr:MAG: 5-formyltetrahydrofolate cyclo-ligase [Desulfobulbus propionicus]
MRTKQALRKKILTLRDKLSLEEQELKSVFITETIRSLAIYKSARTVFTYLHFRSEVQTNRLVKTILQDQKILCVPKVDPVKKRLSAVQISDPEKDVKAGYMGVPEPVKKRYTAAEVPVDSIDLIIVPGVVFDKQGNRIGYGAGYYDKFFSRQNQKGFRMGLAYALQIVSRVPVRAHDVPMECIVNEEQIFYI